MTKNNISTSLHRVRKANIPSLNLLKDLKESNSISTKELSTLCTKAILNTTKQYNVLVDDVKTSEITKESLSDKNKKENSSKKITRMKV